MLVETLMMKEAGNINVDKDHGDAVSCPVKTSPWDFNDWWLERRSLVVHVSSIQITGSDICHKNAQNNSIYVECHVCKSVKQVANLLPISSSSQPQHEMWTETLWFGVKCLQMDLQSPRGVLSFFVREVNALKLFCWSYSLANWCHSYYSQ